jgi:hypothetical protein
MGVATTMTGVETKVVTTMTGVETKVVRQNVTGVETDP